MNPAAPVPNLFDFALFAPFPEAISTEEQAAQLTKQVEQLQALDLALTAPTSRMRPTEKQRERCLEVALRLAAISFGADLHHKQRMAINFYANRIQDRLFQQKRADNKAVPEMAAAIGRVKNAKQRLQTTFTANVVIAAPYRRARDLSLATMHAEEKKIALIKEKIKKIRCQIQQKIADIEKMEIIENVLADIERHFPHKKSLKKEQNAAQVEEYLKTALLNPATYKQASTHPLPFFAREGACVWIHHTSCRAETWRWAVEKDLNEQLCARKQSVHVIRPHATDAKKFILSVLQKNACMHLEFQLKYLNGFYIIKDRPQNVPLYIANVRKENQRELQQLAREERDYTVNLLDLQQKHKKAEEQLLTVLQPITPARFEAVKSLNRVYVCANEGAVLKEQHPLLDTRALEVSSWLLQPTAVLPSLTMPKKHAVVRNENGYCEPKQGLVQPLLTRTLQAELIEQSDHLQTYIDLSDTQIKAIVQALLAAWDLHSKNLLLVPEPSPEFLHEETGKWEYQAADTSWQKVEHFHDFVSLACQGKVRRLVRSSLRPTKEARLPDYDELQRAFDIRWKFECFDNERTLGGGRTSTKGQLNHLVKWGKRIMLPVRSFFLGLKLSHKPLQESVKQWILLQLKGRRQFIETSAYSGHHTLWRYLSRNTQAHLWAYFKSAAFVFPGKRTDLPTSISEAIAADLRRHKMSQIDRVNELLDTHLFPLMPPQEAAALLLRIDAAIAYVEAVEQTAAAKPATVYGLYMACFPCLEPVLDLLCKIEFRRQNIYLLLRTAPLEAIMAELNPPPIAASGASAAAEPVAALSANLVALTLSANVGPAGGAHAQIRRCMESLLHIQKKHAAIFDPARFPHAQWGPAQADAILLFYTDVNAYIEQGFNNVAPMTEVDYKATWKKAATFHMQSAKENRDKKIELQAHTDLFSTAKKDLEKLTKQVNPTLLADLEALLGKSATNRHFSRIIELSAKELAKIRYNVLSEKIGYEEIGKCFRYSEAPVDRVLATALEFGLINKESATYKMLQTAIAAVG